jgi:hypothetical protein
VTCFLSDDCTSKYPDVRAHLNCNT